MAIVLRGNKSTPLTHTELDNNFRQFFYSASVSGTSLSLFTTASLSNEVVLPLTAPAGYDYHIQFKEGNAPSGANAVFSSSVNLLYDFRQQHLKHTGSFTNIGNATIDGDLTVTGTVTAQEMRTEFNNASVVFESGSTKFGDTADDIHSFTGSIDVQGNLTVSGRINATEINTTYVTSSILYNSGSNIFGDAATDKHIFTGSIVTEYSITGSDLRINEWGSVSASLSALSTSGGDWNTLVNIPNGIVSSSTQISNLGFISSLPGGIVSGSSLSSPSQGTLRLTTNGVNGSNVDTGLQTGDSPTFAGLTINGAITATGDITAYYSSDERLKNNIEIIPNAIDKINQIKGVSWDWNELSGHEGHDVGVIAQDLEKVLPEVVVDRDNGYKAVRYDKIVALLIEGIKEQQGEINELRKEINQLKEQ